MSASPIELTAKQRENVERAASNIRLIHNYMTCFGVCEDDARAAVRRRAEQEEEFYARPPSRDHNADWEWEPSDAPRRRGSGYRKEVEREYMFAQTGRSW
jgi:hypothetical protein